MKAKSFENLAKRDFARKSKPTTFSNACYVVVVPVSNFVGLTSKMAGRQT